MEYRVPHVHPRFMLPVFAVYGVGSIDQARRGTERRSLETFATLMWVCIVGFCATIYSR